MGPRLSVEAACSSLRDWSQAALSLFSCVPGRRPGAPAHAVTVHERLRAENSAGRKAVSLSEEAPDTGCLRGVTAWLWGSVPLPLCL